MKVNYADILLWTAKKLKEHYPKFNIYVDENEEHITKPSFFIEVSPTNTAEKLDFWKYKTVNIIIEYINTEAMAQDKLQIADEVSDIIGKKIIVTQSNGNKRALPVFDKKFTIRDATIILATIEYFDGCPDPQTIPYDRDYDDLMGILALNT